LSRIRKNKHLFEEIKFFEADKTNETRENDIEHCVIIERPLLTLKSIVSSMAKQNYRTDHDRLDAYLDKIQKVFKKVGHSISMLHRQSIIHGSLQLDSFIKFEDGWKLAGLIGCQIKGNPIKTTGDMDASVPPEVVTYKGNQRDDPHLLESYPASPLLDIWAFGKLLYEVFVGKSLIPRDSGKKLVDDKRYLNILGGWSEDNLMEVVSNVEDSGNGTLAADLISHCLCKRPELRPQSMEDVLSHPYWSASPAQRRSTAGIARKYNGSSTKRRFLA
jgi:Protein kinase domain.